MRDDAPTLLALENNDVYLPSMLCAPTREAVSECLHRHWQVPTGSDENQQLLRRAIAFNREEDIPVTADSLLFGLRPCSIHRRPRRGLLCKIAKILF